MGHIIEKIAIDRGHKVIVKIDPVAEGCEKEINETTLKDVDVCIDFTHPDVIMNNIEQIAKAGKNIVVGTTGWYDKMDEVKKIVENNNIGAIWSGNFSIGVNAFFKIIENASKIFNNLEDYNISMNETHHIHKVDKPSGTAKMIADRIISSVDRKNNMVIDNNTPKPGDINIECIREGEVFGIHEVKFESDVDTIILNHTAKSREGFALGSVLAAEFLEKKTGFYDIEDLMKEIIK